MNKFGDITISTSEYRPCYVNGKKALFHKWEEFAKPIAPSALIGGDPGGQIKYTLGLIEYEDGQIAKVEPTCIKFCDYKLNEYAFDEMESA